MKKLSTYSIIIILAIACLVTFLYWPVQKFEFLIGWDDQWFVTNHYTEGGFTLENLSLIFSDFYYGQYAPLNQLYYTIIYSISGYNTSLYHISSIFIHIINSILIFYFLKGLLGDIDSRIGKKHIKLAGLSAILFAVMPINVEPVAWVAASKVLIYGMFYLLALIAYRKYLKKTSSKFFYLTLILFLFSYGAKEQAVVLPFCLLLLDYSYSRYLKNKSLWLEKIPFFLMAIIFGLATLDSQQIDKTDFYTLWQRIPLFFYTISEYLIKCIFPVNLSYLYPFPFLKTESIPIWMWVHVIFIPIIIYFFFTELRQKVFLFCSVFFLIHIFLVSNLFSLARYSVIADRYAYISAIGPCLLLSLLLLKYSSQPYRFRFIAKGIGIVYFSFLIGTSFNYVDVWRNAYILKKRMKTTIESRLDFQKK